MSALSHFFVQTFVTGSATPGQALLLGPPELPESKNLGSLVTLKRREWCWEAPSGSYLTVPLMHMCWHSPRTLYNCNVAQCPWCICPEFLHANVHSTLRRSHEEQQLGACTRVPSPTNFRVTQGGKCRKREARD